MATRNEDDNPLDFTVFDLAERIAEGMELSKAANVEVARELLAWREIVTKFATTTTTTPHRNALEAMRELSARLPM